MSVLNTLEKESKQEIKEFVFVSTNKYTKEGRKMGTGFKSCTQS